MFNCQRTGGDGWAKYTESRATGYHFPVAAERDPERDQGVARGPGGPPYFGAETAMRFGDCELRGCGHLAT